jgi:hypothetical protein
MKKASLLVVACVALGALTVTSSASAAYNTPKQAKKMFVEMVPSYNQCTAPSLTHRPNLANPACPPVQTSANNPTNIVTSGQKAGKDDGTASVTLQAAKGDVKISAKSKSVWNNGAPYNGSLIGSAIIRATDNGCGAPPYDVDCTMVDFPFPVALACTNGSCVAAAPTANAVVPEAVHAGDKSNIQIGRISITDGDGDEAATGGLFVL